MSDDEPRMIEYRDDGTTHGTRPDGEHVPQPTLVDFLLARIAEDEAVANAAGWPPLRDDSGRWFIEQGDKYHIVKRTGFLRPGSGSDVARANSSAQAEHIACWNPARVLAECDAKRRIVGWFQSLADKIDDVPALEPRHNELGMVLRALAQPYADHPDYREEWRP